MKSSKDAECVMKSHALLARVTGNILPSTYVCMCMLRCTLSSALDGFLALRGAGGGAVVRWSFRGVSFRLSSVFEMGELACLRFQASSSTSSEGSGYGAVAQSF